MYNQKMPAKDFDSWNEHKKDINKKKSKYYHTREIWWTSIGLNIGDEQDGTGEVYDRPTLIIKSLNQNTCFIIPLTTSEKKNFYRIPLGIIEGKESHVAISQLRIVDTRRFIRKITKLDKDLFETIRKAVRDLF